MKQQFEEVKKDLDFQEIKQEINRGIAEEKAKLEDLDETIIVDMYGNEHRVQNVESFRADLSKEEIEEEIKKLNEENLASAKSV